MSHVVGVKKIVRPRDLTTKEWGLTSSINHTCNCRSTKFERTFPFIFRFGHVTRVPYLYSSACSGYYKRVLYQVHCIHAFRLLMGADE